MVLQYQRIKRNPQTLARKKMLWVLAALRELKENGASVSKAAQQLQSNPIVQLEQMDPMNNRFNLNTDTYNSQNHQPHDYHANSRYPNRIWKPYYQRRNPNNNKNESTNKYLIPLKEDAAKSKCTIKDPRISKIQSNVVSSCSAVRSPVSSPISSSNSVPNATIITSPVPECLNSKLLIDETNHLSDYDVLGYINTNHSYLPTKENMTNDQQKQDNVIVNKADSTNSITCILSENDIEDKGKEVDQTKSDNHEFLESVPAIFEPVAIVPEIITEPKNHSQQQFNELVKHLKDLRRNNTTLVNVSSDLGQNESIKDSSEQIATMTNLTPAKISTRRKTIALVNSNNANSTKERRSSSVERKQSEKVKSIRKTTDLSLKENFKSVSTLNIDEHDLAKKSNKVEKHKSTTKHDKHDKKATRDSEQIDVLTANPLENYLRLPLKNAKRNSVQIDVPAVIALEDPRLSYKKSRRDSAPTDFPNATLSEHPNKKPGRDPVQINVPTTLPLEDPREPAKKLPVIVDLEVLPQYAQNINLVNNSKRKQSNTIQELPLCSEVSPNKPWQEVFQSTNTNVPETTLKSTSSLNQNSDISKRKGETSQTQNYSKLRTVHKKTSSNKRKTHGDVSVERDRKKLKSLSKVDGKHEEIKSKVDDKLKPTILKTVFKKPTKKLHLKYSTTHEVSATEHASILPQQLIKIKSATRIRTPRKIKPKEVKITVNTSLESLIIHQQTSDVPLSESCIGSCTEIIEISSDESENERNTTITEVHTDLKKCTDLSTQTDENSVQTLFTQTDSNSQVNRYCQTDNEDPPLIPRITSTTQIEDSVQSGTWMPLNDSQLQIVKYKDLVNKFALYFMTRLDTLNELTALHQTRVQKLISMNLTYDENKEIFNEFHEMSRDIILKTALQLFGYLKTRKIANFQCKSLLYHFDEEFRKYRCKIALIKFLAFLNDVSVYLRTRHLTKFMEMFCKDINHVYSATLGKTNLTTGNNNTEANTNIPQQNRTQTSDASLSSHSAVSLQWQQNLPEELEFIKHLPMATHQKTEYLSQIMAYLKMVTNQNNWFIIETPANLQREQLERTQGDGAQLYAARIQNTITHDFPNSAPNLQLHNQNVFDNMHSNIAPVNRNLPIGLQFCAAGSNQANQTYPSLLNARLQQQSTTSVTLQPPLTSPTITTTCEMDIPQCVTPPNSQLISQITNSQHFVNHNDNVNNNSLSMDDKIKVEVDNDVMVQEQSDNEEIIDVDAWFERTLNEVIDVDNYKILDYKPIKEEIWNTFVKTEKPDGYTRPLRTPEMDRNVCIICKEMTTLACNCDNAFYCSEDCAKLDWSNHSVSCSLITQ